MLRPSVELTELYDAAYRQAYHYDRADDGEGYYYVSDTSEYGAEETFDSTLAHLVSSSDRPLTVLDVGSGNNVFLSSKIEDSGAKSRIRAFGISAVSQFTAENITHVTGDLLRPNTWRPNNSLRPGSVDLAVSNLAFQNLVDPLRGLANVIPLIKPGGHLVTDEFTVRLAPTDRDEVLEALFAELDNLKSNYGAPECTERGDVITIGGVFGSSPNEPFEHIVATINPEWSRSNDYSQRVLYTKVA